MSEFVTVRWLTGIDYFKQHVRLVAGAEGLDRKVTFVTVQEAPDFYTLLDGGEFVLSTWYTFRDNLDEGLDALRNLNRYASGVCVKINRFIDEIPQSYKDFADEVHLPLFTVDRAVNFREVIKNISIELNMSQMKILIQINDYYDFLFKSALENGSADSMLADFFQRTGLAAISLSPDFKQIRGQKALSNLHDRKSKMEALKKLIRQNQFSMEAFSAGGYHIFPCIASGSCYGYLIVFSPDDLSESQKLYITQLRNVITLKWLDRQEKENDELVSLLHMIEKSPQEHADRISSVLYEKAIDVRSGVRAIVLKYNAADANARTSAMSEAQLFILSFRAILPNALPIWNRAGSLLVVFVDRQGSGYADNVPSWLQETSVMLERYSHIRLAVGPAVDTTDELRTSIRIATNTLLFSNGQKLAYYGDYLSFMGLLSGANSRECDYFIDRVINPIVRYDEDTNNRIIETLACMIECGDINEAAAKLNVHINSVRYRLQKIKAISGLDFFDALERYSIITAFTMYRNKAKYLYQND